MLNNKVSIANRNYVSIYIRWFKLFHKFIIIDLNVIINQNKSKIIYDLTILFCIIYILVKIIYMIIALTKYETRSYNILTI